MEKGPDRAYKVSIRAESLCLVMATGRGKMIDTPSVFRTKINSAGAVEWPKALVIAKACSQTPGIDFLDTFAPEMCSTNLRVL